MIIIHTQISLVHIVNISYQNNDNIEMIEVNPIITKGVLYYR